MKRLILQPKYWILPILVWSGLVLASFSWNWDEVNNHTEELVTNRARFIFKMIESMRLWNARHGGVYAPIDEDTPPNPYLHLPRRDITAQDGTELTLLNPAYMTRQLADVVQEISQVGVHLTSLKPLNPNNKADLWEARALEAFERGQQERLEVVGRYNKQAVRYMAPLYTEQECLDCHQHQGYQVGDVRGGISIRFSAMPLLKDVEAAKRNLFLAHGGVWFLVCGLLLIGLSQLRRQMLSLRQAKAQQDALVELRTAELQQEISIRKANEDQLRTLSKAVEYSPVSTMITDARGRIEYVNPKFSEITGFPAEEVIGKNPRFLQSGETPSHIHQELWDTISKGRVWQGELLNRKKNGELYWDKALISPILDAQGQISHFVSLKEDITEHKAMQDKIWRQATHDDLTGLPNRKLFHQRLQETIHQAQDSDSQFALMFIDLDGFKAINDSLGHDAGDQLLKETAQRIAACVRQSDTVARLGGDEFTLILPKLNSHAVAGRIATTLIERLSTSFQLGELEGRVSASIGIALYPGDGTTADELLKKADSAMYRVKHRGRKHYCFYDQAAAATED